MRYAEPRFEGDAAQYPFHFLPYMSQQFGDGSAAHLPWLQEMPDPLTSAMWSSWVEINPQTAERLQLAQGDLVDITVDTAPESSTGSRIMRGLTAVAHTIAEGSVAAYYPEANVLVALDRYDVKSGTPSYKSIPVQIRASAR